MAVGLASPTGQDAGPLPGGGAPPAGLRGRFLGRELPASQQAPRANLGNVPHGIDLKARVGSDLIICQLKKGGDAVARRQEYSLITYFPKTGEYFLFRNMVFVYHS